LILIFLKFISNILLLLQVCNIPGYEHERKLHPDDLALNVQTAWKTRFDCGNIANNSAGIAASAPNANMATSPQSYFSFVLKRNPDNSAQMARRRVIRYSFFFTSSSSRLVLFQRVDSN
jgi:hypothetical protein